MRDWCRHRLDLDWESGKVEAIPGREVKLSNDPHRRTAVAKGALIPVNRENALEQNKTGREGKRVECTGV